MTEEYLPLLEVGKTIRIDITSYTHEGLGVGKINGINNKEEKLENFPFFIFGVMLNERCLVKITKMTKTFGYAEVEKIYYETTNPNRVIPMCESYPKCGGCNIMHMSYNGQKTFKQEMIKSTLEKLGGLTDLVYHPLIGADNPTLYRNKVQVPVNSVFNKTRLGFYERDSHNIVPLTKCYIQSELSTALVIFVKNIFTELGVMGYNEKYDEGILKHILIRKNHDESEFMVIPVVKNLSFLNNDFTDKLISKIINKFKMVKTIVLNVNPKKGNTILGDEQKIIYGKGYITDKLCGLLFNISAKSFYQVNHEQTEKLYNRALELANLTKDDILIDAYCGIGTIGLIASKKVKEVYGVEIINDAVINAKENAKLNNIVNAKFVCNTSEDQIQKWLDEGIKPSIIVVDPPRKGCDETLLNSIIKSKINKVLYISCNPATLARDLRILVDHDYQITDVQGVDLFPQTSHVETVVCLERK